jgi:phosphatidylserine/phosphatidylglycerophosphate/cardiolipin synthase-like enzyme
MRSLRFLGFLIGTIVILSVSGPLHAQCTVEAVFSPHDNVEKIVVQRLSEANESIKCSLYGITNRAITDVLKQKMTDGVKVTLCLDKTQSAGKSSTHRELKTAGADVVVKKSAVLEHNKFCIIDDTRVIMGSWNYSASAQKQDNSMVDLSGADCAGIVGDFQAAFERIYERDK